LIPVRPALINSYDHSRYAVFAADWWRVADPDSFRPCSDMARVRQPKFEESQQKRDLF